MSLKNIVLPQITLQQLFKESLVQLNNEPAAVTITTNKDFATLGNNERKILIMVADETALYLQDIQLNFLLGILSACGLTMNDVAIFNTKKNTAFTYESLTNIIPANTIVLFGVSPSELQLPVQFPHYQVQHFNKQNYLSAPSLEVLQHNNVEKTKLWNCLKQIFSL